ncbi:unnamed protein product [Rhizophagus irregularis]|uniref:Uncharacterized protein n=1 Tax=Rhizophagus irregularis TaxID=588596 RepID=A0A915ZFJ4_9GLOM|nr:unnamed protein product [Rhizophagus irregularis]
MSIHLQKFYFISRRGVNVITQRILLKEILGYKTFRFSSQISSSIFVTTRKNNTEIIIEDDAHHRKRIWSYLERGSGKDQRRITINKALINDAREYITQNCSQLMRYVDMLGIILNRVEGRENDE